VLAASGGTWDLADHTLTISGVSLTQMNLDLATLTDTNGTAGTNNITLTAHDSFGNSGTAAIDVTVNGVPVFTVPGLQTLGFDDTTLISGVSLKESGNTTGETFSVTLTDSTGVLAASGGTWDSADHTLTISDVSLTQVNLDLATLTDTNGTAGTNNITLTAHDSFGNSGTAAIDVTVNPASWAGDTLVETYYFPSYGTVYYTSPTFTVPASGIDGLDQPGTNNVFQLSVNSTSITVSHFAFDDSFTSASFNGFEIVDESHSIISGVTIDSSTNMVGLTAADISFGSDYVEVNWEGLSFTTSTIVTLDLTFDPPLQQSQVNLTQTLDGSASPASNAGTLTVADGTELALAGTIDNSGVIAVDGASDATAIGIEGSVTLQGGGHIQLSDSNENYIFGDGTLTNVDNTISGSGDIGNGSLIFNNAGVIETSGGPYALIIDTGTNPFVNTGTLETDGGTLIIDSPVTGGGNAIIAGGTLEFSAASDNNVTFTGNTAAILVLDQSQSFTGTISGLGTQAQIDLGDIAFSADTTLSYAANSNDTGGTLIVSDGTHTVDLTLLGSYTASSFATSSDGHGGVYVSESSVDISGSPVMPMISAGGSLDISGPSSATVTFEGGTGTLVLSQPETFDGQISGFTGTAPNAADSDTIDLLGFNYAATTFSETSSNGNLVLTATDGSNVSTLTFVNFNATLDFASDGSGGTLVTDPPAGASATVEGEISVADAGPAGAYNESVTPQGSGYVGAFFVEPVTESNGGTSIEYGFTLGNDQINFTPGQTLTQSYGVSVTDAQNPSANVNQMVSVSIGGPGNDNFVFQPGIGTDTIINFNPQADTIELDHFANIQNTQQLASFITTNTHGDAVIELGHNDSISIPGVTASYLQAHLQSLVHLH
jgi:hypothetical protein